MKRVITMALLPLLAWPCFCLAEPARMSRADSLYEKPFADARVLSRLPAGQALDIKQRTGAWYQVTVAGKTGWARLLSVRRTAGPAAVSSGSLAEVATGRAGSGGIVATTGVRGLSEEAIAAAVFSESAVAAAEQFRESPADAARLAGAAGLAPRDVPPLPLAAGPGGTP